MNSFCKGAFLVITITSSSILWSQSEYLDQDYGVNGVSTIDSWGYPYLSTDMYLDSLNRAYFSARILQTGDSTRSRYLFTRLDEGGVQDDWGIDLQPDSSFFYQVGDFSFRLHWMTENDKIISSLHAIEDGDTTYKIFRYDSDLNLEVEYQHDSDLFNTDYLLYYYFLNGNTGLMDDSGKFTFANNGRLFRFNENGTKDLSFSGDGELQLYKLDSEINLGVLNIYTRLERLKNNSTLHSSLEYVYNADSTELSYRGRITKVDKDGNFDLNFGEQGYVVGDSLEYFWQLEEDENTGIYVQGLSSVVDTCTLTSSDSYIMKLDQNGQLDLTFGEEGYYRQNRQSENCTYQYLSNFIQGPQGELLLLSGTADLEDGSTVESYDYHLSRVNNSGELDLSFGDQGHLDIDLIPGGYINTIQLDKDYNLYTLSIDSLTTTEAVINNFYVSKIKADKVWSNITATASDPLELLIYPNPSLGSPRLKNEGRSRLKLKISLFDITGRLVSEIEIPELSQEEDVAVSNRVLSPGTYMVEVSDAISRSTFWEKIVVVE